MLSVDDALSHMGAVDEEQLDKQWIATRINSQGAQIASVRHSNPYAAART